MVMLMISLCSPMIFAQTQKADKVFVNGNIYTVDEKSPKATALAVKGDKLIYVGNDEEVKNYIDKNT
ncbi:MAG: hypothetical protein PWQ68_1223 [Thermoanaerobacteraceae bacterium]|nr:hypothetical protein [Thermoanaerobacteraceae bacterium]